MKRYETQYDLKPCPFCGGEGHLERRSRCFIDGQSTRAAFVRCKDCYAMTGKYKLTDFGESPNHSRLAEEAAVNHWNSRKE